MTLKECCRILGVARTARVDDVKRAYRRRAFELHPDLNPHLVDAKRQFQLLNEAYVTLMRVLPQEEVRTERERAQAENASAQNDRDARDGQNGKTAHDEERAKNEKAAHEKTFGDEKNSEHAERAERAEQARADNARTEYSRPKTSQSGSTRPHATRPESSGTEQASAKTDTMGTAHSSAAPEGDDSSDARQRRMADAAYTQREDVLHDILSDQFARRVFEDIYSELNRKRPPAAKTKPHEKPAPPPAPPKKRKLNLEWGDTIFKFDMTDGLGGMMRSWLRKQIDDTLTVRLPAARLFPGARVRLQIRQGLSQELRVIEVTLPPDFKTGKPIRLKGMGRKVGKWTGDLYLTINAA